MDPEEKMIDERRDVRIHSIDNKILLVILRHMLMRDALQRGMGEHKDH